MKRFVLLSIAATAVGCDTTLPSEESVTLRVADVIAVAGAEVSGLLVNGSSERVDVGVSCWMRFIDAATQTPIAPQDECDYPGMWLEPQARYSFTFITPVAPGTYQLEVSASASDRHSESTLTRVRSQPFTVTGPTPPE